MIGDEYLQLRAHLGTTLFSLSTLAHGVQAGRDALQSLQELRANLRQPFVITLIGEAKSGKSSLVNALFGREIFSAATPLASDKIHVFKYGANENADGLIAEHHHPNTLLRDFHIIDTPATSAMTVQQQAVVEKLLPETDVALFVFSITNPWAPSAWEFLNALSKTPTKTVVFVMQQCDLRDEFEVDAVWKHLEQVIQHRYSPEARVFAVSAKKAYLARTTGTDKEGLLQQSHFSALETYINDTVAHSEERLGTLRSVWHTAQSIFADVSERIEWAQYVLKRDAAKLEGLQHGIEDLKEQSQRHVSGLLWTLAQSYERMQKRGERTLEEMLSLGGALPFRKTGAHDRPEEVAEFEESVRRQIRSAVELVEADLHDAMRQLHDYARKQISANVNAAHPPEFMEEREKILEGIEAVFVQKASETHMQQRLREFFEGVATWLKVPHEGEMQAVIDALAWRTLDDFKATFDEARNSARRMGAVVQRNRIIGRFRTEMARKREELIAALEPKGREATGRFYEEAATICQPLSAFFTVQKGIYDGRSANLKQLEENLVQAGASLGMPWIQ